MVLLAQGRQQATRREIRTWLSKEKPSLQSEIVYYSDIECLVLVVTSPHSRGYYGCQGVVLCGSVFCSSLANLTVEMNGRVDLWEQKV